MGPRLLGDELVSRGVVHAVEGPRLHAGLRRVDVADRAAAHVGGVLRVELLAVPPEDCPVRGVVVLLQQPAGVALLDAVPLEALAPRVHLGDLEPVAGHDLGGDAVAQLARAVEAIGNLVHLVPAVSVSVDGARVVPVGAAVGAVLVVAVPLPRQDTSLSSNVHAAMTRLKPPLSGWRFFIKVTRCGVSPSR